MNKKYFPAVSVVIPVLNCEQEVAGCMDALEKQSYPRERLEVIVADNGSSDGTVEKLNDLNVRYVVQPKQGRSCALNAGLNESHGEIICTTDISCRPHPDWIEKVVACFEDPEVGCVAGEISQIPTVSNWAIRFQQRNNYMSPMHAFNRRRAPFFPFADGANASFRRSVFEEIGDFDESFFKAADVEICYRMFVLTDYKIVFSRNCLVAEPGEPDLKSLLRQRFKMGMGKTLMLAKYPEFFQEEDRRIGVKSLYWRGRDWARQILANFGCILKGEKAEIEDFVIKSMMSRAQSLGFWYGRRYLKKQVYQPERIDSELLLGFLNKSHSFENRIVELSSN
jgi:cellulose synthase/poly-beta-1,6-N-acetylglucosamine synthase-like glycosyltransferase